VNGTIPAGSCDGFPAIGGPQDLTGNVIKGIRMSSSLNLTLCVDRMGVPALLTDRIELVDISPWAVVDGSDLIFRVKPCLDGQLLDLTIIIIDSHQVYDFSNQLDEVSLLQFGKINFTLFDDPVHFWNLMFPGPNQTTQWFDDNKMSLLMAIQPGKYTCTAMNETGESRFLLVPVDGTWEREFNVSCNDSGFHPCARFGFDPSPRSRPRRPFQGLHSSRLLLFLNLLLSFGP
jgi:hypothetical protein